MPSQDEYLDKLLKGISEEEDGATEDGGNAAAAGGPDLDAVAGMTEEEIAKLLAAGSDEPGTDSRGREGTGGGNDSSMDDVIAMLEGTKDSELQEIQDLLQKSDNNEPVAPGEGAEEHTNPADQLLADIEGAENEGDAKTRRAQEKKRRKEEKLARKEAKKAAKAEKKSSKKGRSKNPSFEYEVLDNIVSDAGKIGKDGGRQPKEEERRFEMSPEDAIIEVDRDEADNLIPDIAILDETEEAEEGKEEPKEKNGLFARFMAFLMEEEEEEEKPENENLRLSKENQDIIKELDKENATKDDKGKKDKKKKKEKQKKEPKPKKAPKPKKEKPPKEEEPVIPGSRLTLKKVLPIVLLGASVGAVALIFVNVSMDVADKSVAKEAYQTGDYESCFQNLYGKKLNDEEALMYGRSESILYMRLWYRKYEMFMEEGKEVEALDSLIQTVNNYPVLYEYASQWNAAAEVGEVYSNILNILRDKYGITEMQALEIAAEKSDLEYTKIITAVVNKIPYGTWNNVGTAQSPTQQVIPNQLPEESDISQGSFVDNQR